LFRADEFVDSSLLLTSHLEQAEDCFELARLISDPHAARILRSAAGRHFEQASELELTEGSPSIAPEAGVPPAPCAHEHPR
jgi:hypothetical protein